jgi:hypothetical protein
MVPRGSQNIPTENLTSVVYFNQLGDDRFKLAPLIRATNRAWGDIDLHTVNAANAMLLSDVLVYKLAATTGVSALTGVLAPKVQVPNNINTFKGRQFIYNVIPATVVPKRGTVRTMTKSVREYQASMRQSGIGSHIEGGAYRSPSGSVFLEQELTAFGLSIEMFISLNTAQTAISSAVAKPFFNANRANVTAVSFAKQMSRDLNTFCCGCGDSGRLMSAISEILITIPNASVMFIPLELSQNIATNDRGAPRAFDNQSVSMIEQNGERRAVILKNGATTSAYTTFNGRLAVFEMPTFTFQEGQDVYQPLRHAQVVGDYVTLSAEQGLLPWYELNPNTSSEKSTQKFRSELLTAFVYDHSQDRRGPVSFSNAMQYTRIFSQAIKHNKYHLAQTSRAEAYAPDLVKFVDKFNTDFTANASSSASSRVIDWPSLKRTMQQYSTLHAALLDDSPFAYDPNTRAGTNAKVKTIDLISILQNYKSMVQYPLTTRFDTISDTILTHTTAQTSTTLQFCLPNCIGDLDPGHLPANLFKTMVNDVKSALKKEGLLNCQEHAAYLHLRSRLTETPFDPFYWECLWVENFKRWNVEKGSQSALGLQDKVLAELDRYRTGTTNPITDRLPTGSWPRHAATGLMFLPDEETYRNFLASRGVERIPESKREFIPQGLWSIQGLKYLANSPAYGQGTLSKWAESSVMWLKCLWKKLTAIMPYTIYSACHDSTHLVYLSNLGARAHSSETDGSSIIAEDDALQILMNILDSDLELFQVAMGNTINNTTSPELLNIIYGKTAIPHLSLLADGIYVNIAHDDTNRRLVLYTQRATYVVHLGDKEISELAWRIVDGVVHVPENKNGSIYVTELLNYIRKSKATSLVDVRTGTGSAKAAVTIGSDKFADIWAIVGNLVLVSLAIRDDILGQVIPDLKAPIFETTPDGTKIQINTNSLASTKAQTFFQALVANMNTYVKTKERASQIPKTYFSTAADSNNDLRGLGFIPTLGWTGFVLSYKQMHLDGTSAAKNLTLDTKKISNHVHLFTNYGQDLTSLLMEVNTSNANNNGLTTFSHTSVYRTRSAEFRQYGRIYSIFKEFQADKHGSKRVCHTRWFELRSRLHCEPVVDAIGVYGQDWDEVERLISSFICHSQLTYYQVQAGIKEEGLRPSFDVMCARHSQKHLMNAVLVGVPGMSTLFNPYTNAHIGMSRDGVTDQYQIRAVVETDTVPVNPQNLGYIAGVSPHAYCGGRNLKFIVDAAEARNPDESDANAPSILACAVSHGYMATTEEPISFINNPPASTQNGQVGDVTSNQFWPGAYYYGYNLYQDQFTRAAKTWNQDAKDVKDSSAQMEFTRWLENSNTFNHILFKGNARRFDPFTETFSNDINGTGHLGAPWMNEAGARDVFEGRTSTPINTKRPPNTSYL